MTKYSVKKTYTVLVGVVLTLVLGVVSFLGLNTDLLPAMDLPYVVVYTVYPGASPERVELAVTQPLEQAVATTSGLENISSISSENLSLIIMEFNAKTNMDSAMIELSNNIDMVEGYLDDMVQSPTLMKINPDMLPVQMLSVDVEGMDIKQLSEYVESDLAPRLERLDGVATVDISGAVHDYVEIKLNQEKIDAINDDILKAVSNTLYKTKRDLDKAQTELTNGKNSLVAAQQQAIDQLAAASAELDLNQAKLQSMVTEKDKLSAQLQMLEGLKGYATLVTIDKGVDALLQLMAVSDLGMNPDTTVGQVRDFFEKLEMPETLPVELPQEIIDQLKSYKTQIISAFDEMAKQDPSVNDKSVTDLQAQLKEMLATTKQTMLSMGIAQATLDSANLLLLEGQIAMVNNEIAAADVTIKALGQAVEQLKAGYVQLEAAKIQATAQLAAGTVQIDSAQAQLDAGVKQFEDARDTALKQANIDALVTQETLSGILMAQNFSMPSGYISDGENRLTVKVGEQFSSLEQLENLLLVDMDMDGVDPIHLKDVADITIKDNSGNSYVRVNGNPSLSLSIQKASTSSTSQVSENVNREVARIMAENSNVHITQLMDQGIFIDLVVSSVMNNMVYGGIIALFVLVFFLKDIKPTLIIGFAIPLSVLFAIVLMYFSGVNLNVMSLSGLALAVGMLVNNSIVVIENIYRLRNLGYSKVKAAVIGAQQVAGAIAASTITTICVFLPIVFTDGLTRQLFTDMGLTIAYSLIASLIVALTVVPAMASRMLTKTKDPGEGIFGKITAVYKKTLVWNLKHKWVVILLTVGLMVYSGWLATKMPMGLIPSMESTQMQMTLTVDANLPDEEFYAQAETITHRVLQVPDVITVGASAGGGGLGALMGGGGSEDTKSMSFYVVLTEDKQHSNAEIAQLIKDATPEFADTLSVTESTMDLGALAGSGISVQIKGNDIDTLQSEATRMADLLKGVEGIGTVSDGSQDAIEEVRIEVNKATAMKNGLTVAQVFQKVSSALTESTTATTVNFENTDMDAIIYASSTYTLDTIGDLVVATTKDDDGEDVDVKLSDIATIGSGFTPQSISRHNQSRYITVTAHMADGYNATLVSRDVEKALAGYEMPKGYSYEMTGEDETVMSAMFDMVKMIALAIVFIYLIMVAQFQSLKSPFIVMFTIPLAFTGGLLALQLTGEMLSIVAMIGFLVLAGVVVNNGIVFVDYVNQLRLEGMEKSDALVQTGIDRIRPIFMTALTTILANSTMAMGVGMGAELSQGMAVVSIGGLAYATLLTLYLVPVLYDIFNRKDLKEIKVDFDDEE
ncbi:MAG: efflux RND transporter permease subunit [Oscillospiraceae bacterium]|nr:efflux RND transporter permease subunit [Oscillospiraceae bacterium]